MGNTMNVSHNQQATSNQTLYSIIQENPNPILLPKTLVSTMEQWPFVLRELATHQLLLCCCTQINEAVYQENSN
uniref:Uncharacterized protein n=1 Tax=Arundo donax TaxID=35708 RepID=A0A0A8YSK1_ARUDO